jgi:hypothetical protein
MHLIFGPAVFDGYSLALDITTLPQSLAKYAQFVRVHVKRLGVEKPDHWDRLLRTRCERPRSR